MKNVLTLSLIAAATIQAAEPMVPGSMSTDRGGVKSAIDAYSDGGGAYLYDNKGRATYDNSPMNNLVFKYGADAKDSGTSLRDQVKTISPSTADEKLLADKIPTSSISINPPVEGSDCNDFNGDTIDDKITNGVCVGTFIGGYAYLDIFVEGYLGSNGATITEIEVFDSNGQELQYNTNVLYYAGSATYLYSTIWDVSKLNNKNFTYTSNSSGQTSTFLLNYGLSTGISSFRITPLSGKIKKVKLYIGSPEVRVFKKLEIKSPEGQILNSTIGQASWTSVRALDIQF